MNLSWISIVGGGIATAATLAVGVNVTGLSGAFAPTPSPEPVTVYVEQPIVEVPTTSFEGQASLPPLVIAVLPAPTGSTLATPTAVPAANPSGTGTPDAATPPPPPPDDAAGEDSDEGSGEHEDDGGESEGWED